MVERLWPCMDMSTPPFRWVFESEISHERALRLAVVVESAEGKIVHVDPYVPSPVRFIPRIVLHLVKRVRRRQRPKTVRAPQLGRIPVQAMKTKTKMWRVRFNLSEKVLPDRGSGS